MEPFNNWPNDLGFTTNHDEITPVQLKVTGTIPPYVGGTLYRTGPGGYKLDVGKGKTIEMQHWFDGFSQVHRFEIIPAEDGGNPQILYNSRHIVDNLLNHIKKTGSFDEMSFAQKRDPCQSVFQKVMSVFEASSQVAKGEKGAGNGTIANVGVTLSVNPPGLPSASHGSANGINSLYTKTDANAFARIDPTTLEPLGYSSQVALHPSLSGPLSGAHAKADPVTGDVFNYNLDFGASGSTYRIFRVSKESGKTDILATIKDAPGAYIHSISLSENFIILCVWAGHYQWAGTKIIWDRNIVDALEELDVKQPALWYVIDRKGKRGVVKKFKSDPFFCFHTINAWEEASKAEGGESQVDVIVELSSYENLDIIKKLYYQNALSTSSAAQTFFHDKGATSRSRIARWRLSSVATGAGATRLTTGKAVLDIHAPKTASCELSTINPTYITKQHRYTYGVTDRGESTFFDGLNKCDIEAGTVLSWSEQGHSPGEAIFIPNPSSGDGDEEDGVLLSVVLDGHNGTSYLLILDPRTMKEIGRAEMNWVVPFGFHGVFYGGGKTGLDY